MEICDFDRLVSFDSNFLFNLLLFYHSSRSYSYACAYVDAYVAASVDFFVLSFVLPCAYAYVASEPDLKRTKRSDNVIRFLHKNNGRKGLMKMTLHSNGC